MCEGYAVSQLLNQLHTHFVQEDSDISDKQKSSICEALAVNESRLLDGASEYLQLMDVAAIVMKSFAQGA